jgi:cyanuric acid amidohydrolase
VAQAVADAMHDAGIDDAENVHFVQVKCPLLTSERMAEAQRRGTDCATTDTLKSMGLSRAAASLGIATALGEIESVDEAMIGRDLSAYSTRASASAGIELLGHEIVVLGRGRGWSGPLRIDHAVMTDALDVEPVRAALARLGLGAVGQLAPVQRERLVAVLAKAEAPSGGRLRDFRHTMLTDSDLSPTRHARGFLAGVLAGLVGHAELYVSGGAEHQGPDGGGPVAVIAADPNGETEWMP